MSGSTVRTVINTCVAVGAYKQEDDFCGHAIARIVKQKHVVVVCPRLLREYLGVLAKGDRQMYPLDEDFLFNRWIRTDVVRRRNDPEVTINFGPEEDRFHIQLAIEANVHCHVSKDDGVLAEAANMAAQGIAERHPTHCLACGTRRE